MSDLADFAFDVVKAILIPQAEAVVVEIARIALEDARPLGFAFVDDGGGEVEVVEASVVSLAEGAGSGSVGRTHPDVHVAFIVDDTASVGSQSSVNVNLVVRTSIVESIKELSVALDGAWNVRGETSKFSFSEVFAVGESDMRTKSQIGVDFNVLDQVGGHWCGLVHLEVEKLEFNAMVQILHAPSRQDDRGSSLKSGVGAWGKHDGDGSSR